ncbi:helix-turn-helix domain-containing protein [Lactococcus lactis]
MRKVLIELLKERNITEYKLSKMTGISTGHIPILEQEKQKRSLLRTSRKLRML